MTKYVYIIDAKIFLIYNYTVIIMKGNENMHINLPKKGNKTNLLKKSLALILSGAVTIPLIVPGNTSVITDRSLIYAEADNVTYGDVNSDGKNQYSGYDST